MTDLQSPGGTRHSGERPGHREEAAIETRTPIAPPARVGVEAGVEAVRRTGVPEQGRPAGAPIAADPAPGLPAPPAARPPAARPPAARPPACGDAPGDVPVVFLHGLLESPAIWAPQRAALAQAGHRSLAPPLPGHRADALHGRPAIALTARPGALVRHVAGTIAARSGGGPVRLVGHSLGGLLALLVARAWPEMVRDVLIVGALHAGACGRPETLASWLVTRAPAIGPLSARWLHRRWVSDPARFEAWMAGSLAAGERYRAPTGPMRAELAGADPDVLRALAGWLSAQDALGALAAVDCPVTCVIPARDPVVAPAHQLALARALPRAVAQVIDSGHLPMLSAPDLLSRMLLAWAGAPQPAALPAAAAPRAATAVERTVRDIPAPMPGA